jgi:flagellin
MRINTNIMAINAQNKLAVNQKNVESSVQKLSTGLRINSAADDASGLAISEKMRAQIRGLAQAESNAQDGISMIQTAEGALQQTTDILQRMRELVIKAQNTGVLTTDDKVSIDTELTTLRDEIDRIATSTSFNSKKLLDGSLATQLDTAGTTESLAKDFDISVASAIDGKSYEITVDADAETATITWGTADDEKQTITVAKTLSGLVRFSTAGIEINVGKDVAVASLAGTIVTKAYAVGFERAAFKIGANAYKNDVLYLGIDKMDSFGLTNDGTRLDLNINTSDQANNALEEIDYAINKVSAQRSVLGAMQNRMEYSIENLSTTQENLSSAESRIRDVDMAAEMVSYTKDNILNQSAMAMLAQANQQPQQILSLLQ